MAKKSYFNEKQADIKRWQKNYIVRAFYELEANMYSKNWINEELSTHIFNSDDYPKLTNANKSYIQGVIDAEFERVFNYLVVNCYPRKDDPSIFTPSRDIQNWSEYITSFGKSSLRWKKDINFIYE